MHPSLTLPELIIDLDGTRLPDEIAQTLGTVMVRQVLSLPTQCEFTCSDLDASPLVTSLLRPGAALRLTLAGSLDTLFDGQVTAVEYVYGPSREQEIRIRAYDVLHQLRKRQPIRAHVQVTWFDLARELVRDLGITVQGRESTPVWQRIMQQGQSDFELLSTYAERCGLYFSLHGKVLHVLTLQGGERLVPLSLGDTLLEARVEMNGDAACGSISTLGWDPLRAEKHVGDATTARVGRDVAAQVPPSCVGAAAKRIRVDEVVQDDRQALARAQAELDARVASEVTLWGVAEGNAALQPGVVVDVSGMASFLSGRYVLTTAIHTIDSVKGYVTEIASAPPLPRPRSHATGTTLGVVTSVNDPDRLGRIQVSLPTYDDIETGWMEVVAPSGFVALPSVGDLVLVLLAHEDAAQGIVLGSLYGAHGPADTGVEGNNVQRYTFRTPRGHTLSFDDATETIRLESSTGSVLELAPGHVRLHAQTDVDVAAPGCNVHIRGQRIDFERA